LKAASGKLVVLSWPEAMLAISVGVRRRVECLRKGIGDKYGFNGDPWQTNIEGACGEMALAKFLGVYWDGSVNNFFGDDLPSGIQVRTRRDHGHGLLVREADNDDRPYVLLTGELPQYRVHGWMMGRDAKQRQWLHSYGGRTPAYFVPQSALHPIDKLPRNTI
jgi:hypothetical protein